MRGLAPMETMTYEGWFVLGAVLLVGAVVLVFSIWWDNRYERRERKREMTRLIARRDPATGKVTYTSVARGGRHLRRAA